MVAVSKTQQKRAFRRIDAKTYHVESLSETLGYHVVRQDGRKGWHCDKFCRSYGYRYQCGHIDVVIRHERWLAEAYASMDKAVNALIANYEAAAQEQDEYSTLEAGDGPVYDGNGCCGCTDSFEVVGCPCPHHSVVALPPDAIGWGTKPKRTLESLFEDYA